VTSTLLVLCYYCNSPCSLPNRYFEYDIIRKPRKRAGMRLLAVSSVHRMIEVLGSWREERKREKCIAVAWL